MSRTHLELLGALLALAAPAFSQTTIRVTAGLGGAEPDGFSEFPAISGDGRFVAFVSAAENLVANDGNGVADVFLFDASTATTELVSVRLPGPGESDPVSSVSVSDDGNLVVYASSADDLAPGGAGFVDVLVRDRTAGTTTRLTTGWTGNSGRPSISADGRFIAFESSAENVVASGPAVDVFLHDRQNGITTLVSRDSSFTPGNGASSRPAISADGQFVAFDSFASNLVPNDVGGLVDVFVLDVYSGTTRRVSISWLGDELAAGSIAGNVSGDGRRVVFMCADDDVTSGDTDGQDDVFYSDAQTGLIVRASVTAAQRGGNGIANQGRISRNGRYVVFLSTGTDLVGVDPTPGAADLYLKDTETNAVEIVSLSSTGVHATSANQPAISADGRYVAFSSAGSLVPGDVAGFREIYVRDRGAIVYTTPCAGDGTSTPCPCGNPGQPGNGCENYALSGGVRLSATGNPSLANDTLRLGLTGFLLMPTPIAFVQGDGLLNGGLGTPFGDGVQCAGGTTIRFGRRNAIGGISAYGAGVGNDAPVSVAGHVDQPGVTRYYQCVYFNFGSFCGQLRRNWSNSIAIVWAP